MIFNKRKLVEDLHYALDQLSYYKDSDLDIKEIGGFYVDSLMCLRDANDFDKLVKCMAFILKHEKFLMNEINNPNSKWGEYFRTLEYYGTNVELVEGNNNLCIITNAIDMDYFMVFGEGCPNDEAQCFIEEDGKIHLKNKDYKYYLMRAPRSYKYNLYDRSGVRLFQIKAERYYSSFDIALVNNESNIRLDYEDDYVYLFDSENDYDDRGRIQISIDDSDDEEMEFDDDCKDSNMPSCMDFAINGRYAFAQLEFEEGTKDFELLMITALGIMLGLKNE